MGGEMASLIELFDSIPEEPGLSRSEAEYRFVEELTFSSPAAILEFLETVLSRDVLSLPVWIRNLAYRLACLQEPNNPSLLRKAAADLRFVGPDWNHAADELIRRAESLEGK
jgi:hypothetical protein